ncbi:chromosome segregation protein SMC [Pseudokineococcus lusitanus]|uniref:Chromosome partition protein Smc n=1 Tax=Pseudokineococcus lusitanus TaxID=763993 RepID=A0A3N1HMP3_9ACTN|nr:chromosome segregation protein SMC [Pseudokineococcus lusitanus]ROP43760.1 condensin subunit Smc [Pseudokineococcus lusitanus]
MHLKTLVMKGFKSFASTTTLRLEPGITCVVGPNGSGKSNVVDALAWVMGEQGAKTLRGGSMQDVIFAGTAGKDGAPGRPPLGRAEVQLTIDNTDGALPLDYTEVTISRTMFRSGGSEYAVNGTPARLLDVQELLSDSGIGREMHVIVGQGQLDAVLQATPEDRRGFVEEAAGVLKHRRRKEKALRKIDAMQANLARLQDLTAEVRRQLGPLGRQAQAARTARTVQLEARDARARLLADDLAQVRAVLDSGAVDDTALRERRAQVEAALAAARQELAEVEAADAAAAPALAAAEEVLPRLQSVREQLRGTADLAAERRRLLGAPAEAPSGPDPAELGAQVERLRAQAAGLDAEVADARAALRAAEAERAGAEEALLAAERRVADLARAAADRREELARLAGSVAARRSRRDAGLAEVGRLQHSLDGARARGRDAEREHAHLETQVADVEEGEEGLDDAHEQAAEALAAVDAALEEAREDERSAERDRSSAAARVEALELGLARKDGSGALLEAGGRLPGVLGPVTELLAVRPGHEAAVAAALRGAAEGVAVESLGVAVDALRLLREDDAGTASLLVAGEEVDGARSPAVAAALAAGTEGTAPVAALDVVTAQPSVRAAVAVLLADVVVVDGLGAARAVLARTADDPAARDLVVVTADGDRLSRTGARGGSSDGAGLLQVQAAADEARAALEDAVARGERARFARQAAAGRREEAADAVAATLERLHESDARLAAVAERLGALGAAARSATAEAERLERSLAAAREGVDRDETQLAELTARHAEAEAAVASGAGGEDDGDEGATAEAAQARREELAAAARAARAAETEARLALRTGEERARGVAGRVEAAERTRRREEEARRRTAEREQVRRRDAAVAAAVEEVARAALERCATALAVATDARAAARAAREERAATSADARRRREELAAELAQLTDEVHRDEVARAQQRLRLEQLEERSLAELGTDATTLVDEMGPHVPVPVVVPDTAPPARAVTDGGEAADGEPPATTDGTDEADEPPVETRPYVRAEQEDRLRKAERALARLGRVNPLALEEFAALEERHAFLVEQLDDLTRSRQDLLAIVAEVDARVQRVFAEAYADVAAAFEHVFSRLFPGGEGRLVLTDPDDMLTTGIDVEARPAGKRVKRLQLLSGGERSLAAVAFLVAIFTARPSPFYVLDEVEAALDDTNLGRLLGVLEELRASSQLLVITHQKRTMEVADALYGVTMRGDGVTTVVSQRLREVAPA